MFAWQQVNRKVKDTHSLCAKGTKAVNLREKSHWSVSFWRTHCKYKTKGNGSDLILSRSSVHLDPLKVIKVVNITHSANDRASDSLPEDGKEGFYYKTQWYMQFICSENELKRSVKSQHQARHTRKDFISLSMSTCSIDPSRTPKQQNSVKSFSGMPFYLVSPIENLLLIGLMVWMLPQPSLPSWVSSVRRKCRQDR